MTEKAGDSRSYAVQLVEKNFGKSLLSVQEDFEKCLNRGESGGVEKSSLFRARKE